jgi:hypothetical protein
MKQFARSVPSIFSLSIASVSLMALAGCGAAGNNAPGAAKNIYAIQYGQSQTGAEQDTVLVFSASATGSTTPTSTLALPSGFDTYTLAAGPQGQIYVGGEPNGSNQGYGQILEYAAGSSGSATPSVTLNGSAAGGTFTYPYELAVNSAGTLFVSSGDGSLEAFASGFTASSVPTQYLTWGMQPNSGTGYNNFYDYGNYLGADAAGDIFYVDGGPNVIDVFAAGATGTTAPVRTITGTNTAPFAQLEYVAVDGTGDVYVANYNCADDPNATDCAGSEESVRAQSMKPHGGRPAVASPHAAEGATYEPTEIIEFAAGANATPTPTNRISGSATNIVEPWGLAVDAASNLYYADANGGFYLDSNPSMLMEVFSPGATGNVAPAASFTSSTYTWENSGPVAVY